MNTAIALVGPFSNLLLVGLLVYYRMNKRFKKERSNGFWAFLDGNLVELIIAAVLIPDGLALMAGLAGKL